jgi:hypothetical protein
MSWKNQLHKDSLPWLLESDNPGVRYLALRDLLDLSIDDKKLKFARRAAHKEGPIAEVLSKMEKEGYWVKPGPGYSPKYNSTVWSMILLAQLGALASEDKRIEQACKYLLDHALAEGGQFTMIASGAPSGTADCVQGNLLWSLMELGYDDPRLEQAYEWMARTVTGDGIAPAHEKDALVRYYATGKCGPSFACGANNKLPCAWGGVKVLLAFSKLPIDKQSPLIQKAIQHGVDFFFSVDPATAAYPTGYAEKPSGNWWKFGFPVFYVTDLLQLAEALVALGYGNDPRLGNTLKIIREKQEEGRWPLEYEYTGKTWIDFGKKKEPNKWVTLRALRILKSLN